MHSESFALTLGGMSLQEVRAALSALGVETNPLAERFLSHTGLRIPKEPVALSVRILDVEALGFFGGATWPQLMEGAQSLGLKPCMPCTGLFLRMALRQADSADPVLTGRHRAPDGAVTVLSPRLEPMDDSFPRGLYLRRVDGTDWLRGYTCDDLYVFSPDSLVALQE